MTVSSNLSIIVKESPSKFGIITVYLKLLQGKKYEGAAVHWWTDEEGQKKRVVCPGGLDRRGEAPDVCPVCKAKEEVTEFNNFNTSLTYWFNVIEGEIKNCLRGRIREKLRAENTAASYLFMNSSKNFQTP